jgi:hypothetical protein
MGTLNLGSDGMGGDWGGYDVVVPMIKIALPGVEVTTDKNKPVHLYIKSHFSGRQPAPPYSCPYICFSGEVRAVQHKKEYPPMMEINTARSGRANEIWFPYLAVEIKETKRNIESFEKKFCCAYVFTNKVAYRERLFNEMRRLEKTC